jgi:hypothetical protein
LTSMHQSTLNDRGKYSSASLDVMLLDATALLPVTP